jgi:predicted RNA-binding Zn ribbon-like protein
MSGSPTVTLTSRDGATFEVATGALCLDFVYTGGGGRRRHWESLHEPADLARWFRGSRLAAIAPIPAGLTLTERDLTAAYALRETLWRVANDLADARSLDPTDAAVLSEWARMPDLPLIFNNGRAAWAQPAAGSQLLSALARDAIVLVTGRLRGRVRRCAADDCTLMFVDTSRPGARRWCAMTRCGNRTKARTRTARRHLDPEGEP